MSAPVMRNTAGAAGLRYPSDPVPFPPISQRALASVALGWHARAFASWNATSQARARAKVLGLWNGSGLSPARTRAGRPITWRSIF